MRPLRLLLALISLLAAAGEAFAADPTYRIGPRDLLEIRVLQLPEMNVERRVSDEGTIDLPLLGSIAAAGLTEGGLRDEIRRLVEERYLQRETASVSVSVKEFRSRPISVLGAVQRPGPLEFPGRWTLLEALTAAGGLGADHGERIVILRRAVNGLSDQLTIEVDALMLRGDARVNIPVLANDVINVPAATTVTIFLVGEVRTPGAVSFKSNERITFLTALARAGGLTDRASRKVTVRRKTGEREEEIPLDARRILEGKDPDVELRQGDVIVVRESFF